MTLLPTLKLMSSGTPASPFPARCLTAWLRLLFDCHGPNDLSVFSLTSLFKKCIITRRRLSFHALLLSMLHYTSASQQTCRALFHRQVVRARRLLIFSRTLSDCRCASLTLFRPAIIFRPPTLPGRCAVLSSYAALQAYIFAGVQPLYQHQQMYHHATRPRPASSSSHSTPAFIHVPFTMLTMFMPCPPTMFICTTLIRARPPSVRSS